MIYQIDLSDWQQIWHTNTQNEVIAALESGQVIFFPKLAFPLLSEEQALLTPYVLNNKAKNISYNPKTKQLKGTSEKYTPTIAQPHLDQSLYHLLARYSQTSHHFLMDLFPDYQEHFVIGRTSYRPAEIKGRVRSVRQDDTRLHVDAFPTTPTQGNRILRIFTNINPNGQDRHWHLGEPFEQVVQQFKYLFNKPIFGWRQLQALLGITKSYRTLYDHYMLQLHNAMKQNTLYQQKVNKTQQYFPPGSTWIVMTDQVSHAALSGQYVLEQTFYLPVKSLRYPSLSPLKVLERILTAKLL